MESLLENTDVHNNTCINAGLGIITNSYWSAPLTVVSSLLSILGSLLIIISYACWKDLRKSTARSILLFLALADFGASIGYLFSAIAYLVVFGNVVRNTSLSSNSSNALTNDALTYRPFCWIESVWDTYFPVVSFFWTTNLAIYFVVTLVFLKGNLAKKLMIPFHLTAWLIPLIICVAAGASKWLGPGDNINETEDTTAAAWCFVSDKNVHNITSKSMFDQRIALYYVMEAICGKGIEVAAYVVVAGCYVTIICYNRCRCCSKVSLAMLVQL